MISSARTFLESRPSLKKIATFIGALAAMGSLLGVFITVNKRLEERAQLEIEVTEIDLIKYVPETQIQTFKLGNIFTELENIEQNNSEVTQDYIFDIAEKAYALVQNFSRVSIEFPEHGSREVDFLKEFNEILDTSIVELRELKEKAEGEEKGEGEEGEEVKTRVQKYTNVIDRLETIQESFQKVEPKTKVYLEARIENGSRLSNYVNPQGILMFNKDEKDYSSIPQIVVEVDAADDITAGKVDGYGVTAITLNAEMEDLDTDARTYTELAFQDRAIGDEEYGLILALEDIKGRVWHEKVSFSTFTEQNIKNQLKTKGGRIFRKTNRPWFLSWLPF